MRDCECKTYTDAANLEIERLKLIIEQNCKFKNTLSAQAAKIEELEKRISPPIYSKESLDVANEMKTLRDKLEIQEKELRDMQDVALRQGERADDLKLKLDRARMALNQSRGFLESMIPKIEELFGKNDGAFIKTITQIQQTLRGIGEAGK